MSAESDEHATFIAIDGERWVAMVSSRWFDQDAGTVQLWGLWVEPTLRGRGVGAQLVDAVAEWAVVRNAVSLRLGVIETAADTEGFCERLGFARNGETRELPRDGTVKAFFLLKPLGVRR